MNKKKYILSTRILNNEQRNLFRDFDGDLIEIDFIQTQEIAISQEIKLLDALLFTSQNAVKSFINQGFKSNGKPTFCVGIKTRNLLEKNNFDVIASADYAEDLAEIIIKHHQNLSISFFNGNLRRNTLPDAFKKANIYFEEFIVYETISNPKIIQTNLDGILFFSPSGIQSYLKNNQINKAVCFCIGTTTAQALPNSEKIIISNPPTIEYVIQDCLNHFKK